jgi:hypothetical protein
LAVIYGGILWGFNGYLMKKAGPLTAKQRADFTTILKTSAAPPEYIKIACPDADEDACIYAATFIPLFQRGRWKVDGPILERVKLGRPSSSVVIVHHGPLLANPQNPDEGVWTKFTVWDQVLTTAFEFIGIHPEMTNDPTLPETMIRVYFGSAPKR